MSNQKDFIPVEEVCTRLNKELNANVFTRGKFMRLVKRGLIKFHDVRTPGTSMIRYAFNYEEVKESLEKLKREAKTHRKLRYHAGLKRIV